MKGFNSRLICKIFSEGKERTISPQESFVLSSQTVEVSSPILFDLRFRNLSFRYEVLVEQGPVVPKCLPVGSEGRGWSRFVGTILLTPLSLRTE